MYCTKCGNYNKEENKYCENCGEKIEFKNSKNINKIEEIKNKEKANTIWIIAISIVLIIIPIVIIGTKVVTLIEKGSKKEQRLIQQAEENAINYIEEKYGFTAQIVKTTLKSSVTFSIPTGKAWVELTHNNKNFEVAISGTEKTIDGEDDYQYDEICNAISEYIGKTINVKPINQKISYNPSRVKELYDGTNIEDFIDNGQSLIILEYINISNLEDIKTNLIKLFNGRSKSITLINYDSIESYNKSLEYSEYQKYKKLNILVEWKIQCYAPSFNVIDAYKIAGDKIYSLKPFELKNHEDIYYSYEKTTNNTNEVTLSNTTISDINNWLESDKTYESVEQISSAYLVNNLHSSIYFYFPTEKIENYEIDNIYIGIECENKYGKVYFDKYDIHGDYLVANVNLKNYCENSNEAKIFLMELKKKQN